MPTRLRVHARRPAGVLSDGSPQPAVQLDRSLRSRAHITVSRPPRSHGLLEDVRRLLPRVGDLPGGVVSGAHSRRGDVPGVRGGGDVVGGRRGQPAGHVGRPDLPRGSLGHSLDLVPDSAGAVVRPRPGVPAGKPGHRRPRWHRRRGRDADAQDARTDDVAGHAERRAAQHRRHLRANGLGPRAAEWHPDVVPGQSDQSRGASPPGRHLGPVRPTEGSPGRRGGGSPGRAAACVCRLPGDGVLRDAERLAGGPRSLPVLRPVAASVGACPQRRRSHRPVRLRQAVAGRHGGLLPRVGIPDGPAQHDRGGRRPAVTGQQSTDDAVRVADDERLRLR